MFSTVMSAAIYGVEGRLVHVEADVSDGLPVFSMVGYLSSQVREAQERVRTALKNTGIRTMPKRITVNLSPADLKKSGTGFDLPIAVAVLASYGFLPQEALEQVMVVGELSLNGKINGIPGILSIVSLARREKFSTCVIPKENLAEGAVIQGIRVIGVESLAQTLAYLNKSLNLEPGKTDIRKIFRKDRYEGREDFKYINGQEAPKRAAEIAAAGMHNLLLVGPPGAGKSMLAKSLPTILPPLLLEESLEISKVYSVAGLLSPSKPLLYQRPFRSPHHTITAKGMAGGGVNPSPGEISLAHRGVLFLDELPEFSREALEVLRQPLEERCICITRTGTSCVFPADFMLVAAMNPCRCGFYPDLNKCSCTENEVHRYLNRISSPLLDRIDIAVEAPLVAYQELTADRKNESSVMVRKRVEAAHRLQRLRYKGTPFHYNSDLTPAGIKSFCALGGQEEKLLQKAYDRLELSARAYHRIVKTARTIADLDGEDRIREPHVSEAICYRSIDKGLWGIQK